MSGSVLTIGADRIRVGPWRGDTEIAYLAPLSNGRPLGTNSLQTCVETLAEYGYHRVITAALSAEERRWFPTLGFLEREQLHLLAHNMTDLPTGPTHKLRRARRTDRPQVLAVDNLAFNSFWQLDSDGLNEALQATPVARFRVAGGGEVHGYAVTGRAANRGYLQRLAVHPDHQGSGIGMSLVADCLEWLARRGVRSTVVNTQVGNASAVSLYQRAGFVLQPDGLIVYELAITS